MRDETGLFVVEGARCAVAVVDARAEVVLAVVAPRALTSPMAQMMARRLRQRGTPEIRVEPAELAELASTREPQGIVLVVRQRRTPIEDVRPPPRALWLVVDGVRSPGNLGTACRTARAVGTSGLVVVACANTVSAEPKPSQRSALPSSPDPFDPGCVRASMGAILDVPVIDATPASLRAFADATGTRLVAAVPRARLDWRQVRYDGAVGIVLGSERKGASSELLERVHTHVRIPMLAPMDSLNVAVASAVMLYEAFRQRQPLGR